MWGESLFCCDAERTASLTCSPGRASYCLGLRSVKSRRVSYLGTLRWLARAEISNASIPDQEPPRSAGLRAPRRYLTCGLPDSECTIGCALRCCSVVKYEPQAGLP